MVQRCQIGPSFLLGSVKDHISSANGNLCSRELELELENSEVNNSQSLTGKLTFYAKKTE